MFRTCMRSVRNLSSLVILCVLVACSSGKKDSTAPAAESQKPQSAQPAVSSPQTHVVSIRDMRFDPADLTVKEGDTVEWKNADALTHNAVAIDKTFRTENLATGASGKWVANKKGSFSYLCSLHPNMKAKLTVE
jgi:plastocyanin